IAPILPCRLSGLLWGQYIAVRFLHRTGDAPPVFKEPAVVLLAADGNEALVLSRQGQGVRTTTFFGKDGAGLDAGFFGGD
ncbi:MAG: hypothetical protein AB1426_12725, partial [Bacillota bacterium]